MSYKNIIFLITAAAVYISLVFLILKIVSEDLGVSIHISSAYFWCNVNIVFFFEGDRLSLNIEQQEAMLRSRGISLKYAKKVMDLPNDMAIIHTSGTVFVIDKKAFRDSLEKEGVIMSNDDRNDGDKKESYVVNVLVNVFFSVILFLKRLTLKIKKAWTAFWRA